MVKNIGYFTQQTIISKLGMKWIDVNITKNTQIIYSEEHEVSVMFWNEDVWSGTEKEMIKLLSDMEHEIDNKLRLQKIKNLM